MRLDSSKLFLILALSAAAVAVPAQQTNIFSTSASELKDSSDLLKDDSQPQLNPGNYAAPRQFFNNYSPSLPMPRPLFLGNQDAATQDALNRRKNWTLLTPEQIFGLQTPEDVLGIKKPDSDKNLSLEEQFLLRESRPAINATTNGGTGVASWRDAANLFDQKNQDDRSVFPRSVFAPPDNRAQQDSARYFKQFLNAKTDNSQLNIASKQATAWSSVFSQPAQPKPTPAQLADMERFRAMISPDVPPDKTPTTKTSFSSSTAPDTAPYFQPQPVFNPAGRSVTMIKDDLTRPVGIKPLPVIGAPGNPAPATRPDWQAQLPPWMRDGPPAHNAN